MECPECDEEVPIVIKNTALENNTTNDYIILLCNYTPDGKKSNVDTLVLCGGNTTQVESKSDVYVLKKRPNRSHKNIRDGEYDLLINLYKSGKESFTYPEPGGEFENHHLVVTLTKTGFLNKISINHRE